MEVFGCVIRRIGAVLLDSSANTRWLMYKGRKIDAPHVISNLMDDSPSVYEVEKA